ncbi:MAG: cyclic nucleotide-binding domain-containing protein [Bacteroidota bacterium]
MRSIFTVLNVRPEERLPVMLMLATGFFMGIFIATYQVTAESLFLNQISGQLNKAFLASGVLGIAATLIFSAAQNRFKFTSLATTAILSVVFFTSTIYYEYNFGDKAYHEYVLFAMYCFTGPMTAILLLSYWGVFGRLFNFKQSKRIIGWIDTGQLSAIIISNFLIPLTASYFPETSNYLIICNISILGSAICFIIISLKFPLDKNNPKDFEESVRKQTSFGSIFKDRYIVLMSLFIIISMITFIFTQYSFQDSLNKQYPNQRELTNFLAYFNGAIYSISLIMQTFVNNKILANYGIRVSLFILPVVVGLFAIGTVLTGTFFGYDNIQSPDAFIFFFLFVALTRLANNSLRESLESPVYKLLFIPLDNRLRFGIQSKVEGVINESGRFLAGIIIFGFALLPLFNIMWISIIILFLVGAYMVINTSLYNGYRNKIRAKLESTEVHSDKLEIGFAHVTQRLENWLGNTDSSKAIFSYKLLEKINPGQINTWANGLMRNNHEQAREYAQEKMNELKGLSVSDHYVIKLDQDKTDSGSKNVLTKTDLQLILNSGGEITKTRIQKLSRSASVEDRQYSAELLLHSSAEENISLLIELLNDPEPKVRYTAIMTSIKKHNNEVIFALIENLTNPLFSNQAMNALTLIAGKSLNLLESAFYRSGQNAQTLHKIVQVMGRIGGQRAKDLLWNKIDYPDKVVVSQVLLSLGECGFKAGVSQITRIKYAIESDIADISWNIGAMLEVSSDGSARDVIIALEQEDQNDIEHVYMLLAMLYDTRSIQLVKEHIESGTTEDTTFAVELLDVFLSDQLKERVIPVLDDLTNSERISRLEAFYPRVNLDEKLVLKFLINRDFKQTNRWTKATVVRQIGKLKITDFELDLIAQLFNPDKLIREVAAWALFEINTQSYHTNAARLGEDAKQDLDQVIIAENRQIKLKVIDKVFFYQGLKFFEGISGLSLSFLADISDEVNLTEGQSLITDEKKNNNFYIIYKGTADYFEKGRIASQFVRGQFIGEMVSAPGFVNSNILVAKEETALLRINKELFYELLAENVKLADRVLEYI